MRQGGSASPRTMLSKRRRPIPFGKELENRILRVLDVYWPPSQERMRPRRISCLATRLEIAFHLASRPKIPHICAPPAATQVVAGHGMTGELGHRHDRWQ